MDYETAGDPMRECKWTRRSTEKVAAELLSHGITISANTVARLLRQMGFRLRLNSKKIESGLKNPPDPKLRDAQFHFIAEQREEFAFKGLPIVSVDTKAREMIGNFCRNGRRWSDIPIEVFDHDFPSDSKGVAIPYGVYDTTRNEAYVSVGTSYDTPLFAVESLRRWWKTIGSKAYTNTDRLLVLADSGGSNGCRSRLWKNYLQTQLCDPLKMHVHVCHYPPGSSKWNPIEHRLFCAISNNWAGRPLDSYETLIKYIRTSTTNAGLRVKASLVQKKYKKGLSVSNAEMKDLSLKHYGPNPQWNYSILPRSM